MSFFSLLQSWRQYVIPAKPAPEQVSSDSSARTTDDDPFPEELFSSGSSDSNTEDDPFPEKLFSSGSSDNITEDDPYAEKPLLFDSSDRIPEDDPYPEKLLLLDPSDRITDDDPCPGNLLTPGSLLDSDDELFVQQELPREPSVLITDDDEAEPHEEWQVLEIVDYRKTREFGAQYKATYVGNWDEWNSNPPWQASTDFNNAKARILDYHSKRKTKSSPQRPRHKRGRASVNALS